MGIYSTIKWYFKLIVKELFNSIKRIRKIIVRILYNMLYRVNLRLNKNLIVKIF